MKFEEIFEFIGDFGTYQVLMIFIVGLTAVMSGYQSVAMNVLGGAMDHWCRIDRLANFTHGQQKYISIPTEKTQTGQIRFKQCYRFSQNFSIYNESQLFQWNRSVAVLNTTQKCSAWVYDQSVFESTAVNKFDLVCDKSWLVPLCSTAYMAGKFAGAILGGAISDKVGRKLTIVVFVICALLFGVVDAFSPNYVVFIIFRFLTSTSVTAAQLCGFVMFVEITGPRWRMVVGVANQIFFAVGSMLTALVGLAIREFTKAQLAMILPMAIGLLFIVVIPESPRWLLTRGREKEALKIITKIAAVNKKTLPDKIVFDEDEKDAERNKATLADLFKTKLLRNRTFIIYINWFTNTLMYYGLSLNIGTLTGNLFLNSFLMALVEVPANIICMVMMGKLGRRITICGSLLFAALAMFGTIPLLYRKDLGRVNTALNLLAKMAVTVSFSGIYVWSAELYPTVVRNVGIGSASMISRVSGMAAPFMGKPLRRVWLPFPSVLFGSFAAVAGLLALLLPETKGLQMPETIEEAKQIGRKVLRKTLTGKTNYALNLYLKEESANGIEDYRKVTYNQTDDSKY